VLVAATAETWAGPYRANSY